MDPMGILKVAAGIQWIKTPGSVAKMTQVGSAIYMKSADRRFMVYVERWRSGQPGYKEYSYHFSAVDYGIPSSGSRYTKIPVGSSFTSTDPKKVIAAVTKWALEHPLNAEPGSETHG